MELQDRLERKGWSLEWADVLRDLDRLQKVGDLRSAQGKLIASLMAALAEFERDLLRERVQQFRPLCLLILERTKAGRWLAPPVAVNRSHYVAEKRPLLKFAGLRHGEQTG